jgi:membrane fusion protein, copper/silver efflux system
MKNFVLGFLAAAILIAGGYFAYMHRGKNAPGAVVEPAKVRYHCPMHPNYISDKPGNCPICGMKLVPIEPEPKPEPAQQPHAGHESMVPGYASVMIPQDRIQSMGITLAEARRMELDQSFRTYGRIGYDETKVQHVHTKFDGYIEDLYANFVGRFVNKGEPLFSIYSPELFATQNEYLLALRAREQMPPPAEKDKALNAMDIVDLVAAAKQRLALWDISEGQILELERTRKPVRNLKFFSPVSGYIIQKTAQQGLRVTPADNLYDVVDLSTIWVQADIYEMNLPSVSLGQPATMSLAYKPGKTWRGRIAFINPTVDPATRTVKARLEFENPNDELKPDMYADVVIGGSRRTGIAVPDSAVIATGERYIAFISKGNGMFEPREVVLGIRVRGFYEIKKGISEGEQVVTGANFLLDSESKLKASISAGSGEHQHGM